MLPLAGAENPDSPDALATALSLGLATSGLPAREVTALGGWPALDLLRLDLTGVQIPRTPLPGPTGTVRGEGFTAARFELVAAPARVEAAPVQLSLWAVDAGFEFAPARDGASMVLIQRAARGEVTVEMAAADIENLVHSVASEAAKQHGAEIKSVKIDFTSRGPRAVSVNAEVTAKMFIATALFKLSGDVDLDEQLSARLSNLRFSGDGMVANLAGSFIRPQLAALEGRTFPLMSFALGEISLRDVQLHAGDTLRLSANFGS